MKSTEKYQKMDQTCLWHPFTPMRFWLESEPLIIDRGEGVYLIDTEGNKYIDGVSSLWCNVHGHRHPHIDGAIRKQLDKIAHSTMLGLGSTVSIELAEKLLGIVPEGLTRIFYSDSGATSVEIAIKMAFQYWRNLGQKRDLFISLKESYHGDTMGSVSIGGIETFHKIFGPLSFGCLFSESPHPYRFSGTAEECRDHALGEIRGILEANSGSVAAIVIEPVVQGAAGVIVHPGGFLTGVRKLADEFGVLLIADEVATGFGRTGTMFACEQEGVKPDIFCIAKGLTGGYLPLAATAASEKVFEAFLRVPWMHTTFYHGHTYTGNCLGCAAAIANLEVFEKDKTLAGLPAKISLIDKYLQKFREMEYVGDVRQKGMMAGIELVADKAAKRNFETHLRTGAGFCQRVRRKGLIIRPLGDVIVLMPPLSIPAGVLKEMLEIVGEEIGDLKSVLK